MLVNEMVGVLRWPDVETKGEEAKKKAEQTEKRDWKKKEKGATGLRVPTLRTAAKHCQRQSEDRARRTEGNGR